MKKIPYIKYIEALFACKYPIDKIKSLLIEHALPSAANITDEILYKMYRTLASTNPDFFSNADEHVPNSVWLTDLEIQKFVAYELKLEIPEGTAGIKNALEILKDKSMYDVISTLALGKIEDEDIDLIVNGRYNIHYESIDIKEFIHYFFNVYDWTLSDKKNLVASITDTKLKKLYELALEGDKDYLIWKLGIAPNRSFDQMLREMMTDSYYNFKEKIKLDPDMAQKWGGLALRITDRIEKLTQESTTKKSILEDIQFILQQPKQPFKHLSELDND